MWNARHDRDLVDHPDEAVLRREGVDAVRSPLEFEVIGLERGDLEGVVSGKQELPGRLDQHRSDPSDGDRRDLASLQRSGDKDHAADFGAMFEDQGVRVDLLRGSGELGLRRGLVEEQLPEFITSVGHQQAADATSHAVADHDHRPMGGIPALHIIQLLPENGR